jgi:hypothetical protein
LESGSWHIPNESDPSHLRAGSSLASEWFLPSLARVIADIEQNRGVCLISINPVRIVADANSLNGSGLEGLFHAFPTYEGVRQISQRLARSDRFSVARGVQHHKRTQQDHCCDPQSNRSAKVKHGSFLPADLHCAAVPNDSQTSEPKQIGKLPSRKTRAKSPLLQAPQNDEQERPPP